MLKKSLLIVILCVLGVVIWLLFVREKGEETTTPTTNSQQEVAEETSQTEEAYMFDAPAIQDALDGWVSAQSGAVSVVIIDPSQPDEIVASYEPNEVYFAASLYKLFVVYAGYQALDDGTFEADEAYLYGQTRLECLDKSIRSSDSPCAETWWNELGKEELTTQMAERGMINTSLTGISTTAQDSAMVMSMIWNGEGLSDQARSQYLSSLEEQDALYRRGLPSGFSDEVTVYNKVGWNLDQEWHDVAIVDFGGDRVLVIAVLSENVGMNNVAQLGSIIESTVMDEE